MASVYGNLTRNSTNCSHSHTVLFLASFLDELLIRHKPPEVNPDTKRESSYSQHLLNYCLTGLTNRQREKLYNSDTMPPTCVHCSHTFHPKIFSFALPQHESARDQTWENGTNRSDSPVCTDFPAMPNDRHLLSISSRPSTPTTTTTTRTTTTTTTTHWHCTLYGSNFESSTLLLILLMFPAAVVESPSLR